MNNLYMRHTYSYIHLRNAVGWIGILLPVVLVAGTNLLGSGPFIQRSISIYYYTVMGDVFVGSLCAVALFLFFYSGFKPLDNWIANICGVFALGVAWFPIDKDGIAGVISVIHLISAASFFLILAFFSIFLFTKSEDRHPMTRKRKKRNVLYVTCGAIMLLSMGFMLVYVILRNPQDDSTPFLFIAESVALAAFGISWLVKGETLLPHTDKEQPE
jgi:hypothetical protein